MPDSWQGRYRRTDSPYQHSLYCTTQSVRYHKLLPPRELNVCYQQTRLNDVLGQTSIYETFASQRIKGQKSGDYIIILHIYVPGLTVK